MGTEKPPGRCFPARCGAAWGGYGAAWAAWRAPSRCPRTVSTANTAFLVFTKHETRITKHGFFSNHGLCCGSAWAAMARHGRHISPRRRTCPVSRSRSASRRAPLAGLLPAPRTPDEPMLREGNVLIAQNGNFPYCVDNTSRTFPRYSDCGPIEAPTPARLMRTSTRFPQSRDSAPCKPCSTSRPLTGLRFAQRGEAKCVRGPSVISSGANHAPPSAFHETRDTAIAWPAARGALWAGANSEVFTKHEARNTNHGLFPACFDRRVVRYAGYCMPRSEKFRV